MLCHILEARPWQTTHVFQVQTTRLSRLLQTVHRLHSTSNSANQAHISYNRTYTSKRAQPLKATTYKYPAPQWLPNNPPPPPPERTPRTPNPSLSQTKRTGPISPS